MKIILGRERVQPPPVPAAIITGIVAQPGGQSGATRLAARVNIVTVVAYGDAVVLDPTIISGQQTVMARGANDLTVYPSRDAEIETYGANIPTIVPKGGSATFTWDGTSTWLVS